MAGSTGNGGATRWMLGVWICLLIFVLGALAANASAVAGNSERIARMEAQYEMIRDDLRDIKRAVGAGISR